MYLAKLLRKLNIEEDVDNHLITCITSDSRKCVKKAIFFAIKGYSNDGHKFINEAIKNGAKTIFHEDAIPHEEGINYICVSNTKRYICLANEIFFSKVLKAMTIIGVTGTNGKTSITSLIHSFIRSEGKNSLLLGTNGYFLNEEIIKSYNTTCSNELFYELLYRAYKKRFRYVITEVSSQGIKELRTLGIHYKIKVFTNLSHDHLDYHNTLEDYAFSKGIFLFKDADVTILNKDDYYYNYYNSFVENRCISYGKEEASDMRIIDIKENSQCTSFRTNFEGKTISFKTQLLGEFSIYNIIASYLVIKSIGLNEERFIDFISTYKGVKGRMDLIKTKKTNIVIDYAHSPDSVLKILSSLKKFRHIYTVVGCGGNRDKTKRPLIGKIATNNSYYVVFTNDNPRNEEEEKIVEDILLGVKKNNYEVIYNREEAIKTIYRKAQKNDCVVILGKGSEEYQIINNIYHPYSDYEVVASLMEEENE